MNSRFRNWSDIRVFLAVMRAGSTLAASELLGMAQPTVARRIDALEHELGRVLFKRSTQGFRPTLASQALLPFAESMEAVAEQLAEEVEKLKRKDFGPIRISATSVAFTPNLAKILAEFSSRQPSVRFELVPTDRMVDLTAGEADIALRVVPKIDDESLICRKISDAASTLYASEGYARANGLPSSPEALKGHSFVMFESESRSNRIHAWLRNRIDKDQVVLRAPDYPSMLTALHTGLGIGPLPCSIGEPEPGIVRCFDPPEGVSVPLWLVASAEAYRRPEVKAFFSFFAPKYQALIRSQTAGLKKG